MSRLVRSVPFYFGITEKLNIYKTQISCLYYDVGFFSCAWANFCKISLDWDAVSSLWAIWRMLLQGLLPWEDCVISFMISFITFKHCLSFKCCELDEVIYFAWKSTQLVKDPEQHRSSLCVKPFSIPLGLFVKQFFVHGEIWGIMLWMLISGLQCKWDLGVFVNWYSQ